MLISSEEYLQLTDRLMLYRKKWENKEQEYEQLHHKFLQLEQKVKMLESQLKKKQNHSNNNHQQIITHVSEKTSQMMRHLQKTKEQQKQFLINHLMEVKEDPIARKLKYYQKCLAQEKEVNKQNNQFFERVKALFLTSSRSKIVPNPSNLFKWIAQNITHLDVSKTFTSTKPIKNSKARISKIEKDTKIEATETEKQILDQIANHENSGGNPLKDISNNQVEMTETDSQIWH